MPLGRRVAGALLAAAVLLAVCAPVAAGQARPVPVESTPAASTFAPSAAAGLLDGLADTIQEIDEFLETVLDLVRTINQLFGEGGAGGD